MKNENAVSSQIDGRIGILKFNRPQVLNAFNEELVTETNEVMNRFIKKILPSNPSIRHIASIAAPVLFGRSDAPTNAIERGRRRISSECCFMPNSHKKLRPYQHPKTSRRPAPKIKNNQISR